MLDINIFKGESILKIYKLKNWYTRMLIESYLN